MRWGMKKKFKTEAELAAVVVEWLSAQGWDVHEEVSVGYAGIRADIVGRRGDHVWVIETKLSLSLKLLEQATEWIRYANFVSIALPHSKGRNRSRFLRMILQHVGVGYLNVREKDPKYGVATWQVPRFNRKVQGRRLLEILDVHENWVKAGSTDGGYWTPFRETARELARFVKEHPGCTMKDAVDGIEHHYAHDKSAVSNLRGYLSDGVIKGIRIEEEGRTWRLFPSTESIV